MIIVQRLTAFFLTVLAGLNAIGQANPHMQTVVAPSPNAASLGKFTETPVSLYTGIPNISVPIYQLDAGAIKIPIALSYHAGGIKVEEAASNVGMGWALQCGGMITRTVKGRPDEDNTGLMTGYFNENNGMTVNRLLQGPDMPASNDSIRWYDKMQTFGTYKLIDAEPDVFTLNLPGESFRFYYNQDRKSFFTNPYSKLQISWSGAPGTAMSWKVIDQNGIVYKFEEFEYVISSPGVNSPELTNVPTSWVLTSIEDPRTNSQVTLTYETFTQTSFFNGTIDIDYYPLRTGFSEEGGIIRNYSDMVMKRIQTITFNGGGVTFNYKSTNRLDITSDKALESVVVQNYEGRTVKKAILHSSYFGNFELNQPGRLRLDKVSLMGEQDKETHDYIFDYSSDALPDRKSLSQDLWGYFNGAPNDRLVTGQYVPGQAQFTPGAYREPSPVGTAVGVLNKITYPTGGYTSYTYEQNRVSYANPGGSVMQDHAAFLYPCQNTCIENQNYAYAYSEMDITINSQSGNAVQVWGELIQVDAGMAAGCGNTNVEIKLVGVNGTTGYYPLGGSPAPYIYSEVPNGEYKLILEVTTCWSPYYADAKLVLHYKSSDYVGASVYHRNIGGLRIKQIDTYDPLTTKTLKKSFAYCTTGIEEDGFSSGNVTAMPVMDYNVEKPASGGSGTWGYYLKRQSYPCIPLATTKGGNVGYNRVVEKTLDEDGSVKFYSIYGFNYQPDVNESGTMPFVPYSTRDHLSGELLYREDYASINNMFVPVRTEVNEYTTIADTTAATTVRGFIGLQNRTSDPMEGADPQEYFLYYLQTGVYSHIADRSLLKKTTVTDYDYSVTPANQSSAVQEYSYSKFNFKPNKITKNSSESNKSSAQAFKYPYDYFTGSATVDPDIAACNLLIDKNILDQVVESKSLVTRDGVDKLAGATFSHFNTLNLLTGIEEIKLSAPAANTEVSSVVSGSLVKSSLLKPVYNIPAYSAGKRLLEQKLTDNIVKSYVWDYGSLYPVAEVVNGTSASIAYTSFEADGNGNWTGINPAGIVSTGSGLTGKKYYSSSSFLFSFTPAGTGIYIVSYWSKNGAYAVNGTAAVTGRTVLGWTYYEHRVTVTGAVALSGSGMIDELRLYPEGAQMVTYTYEPLLGISSQCDINNRTTRYEFDPLGRLSLVRDEQGNILKKYCYNYYNQLGECGSGTAPLWQSTGITRCKPCPSNSSYTSNVQEHQEKDLNTNSASYNNLRWVEDGASASCVPQADWQLQSVLCQLNGQGQNTGNQVRTEKDMNPCSSTYNTTRQVIMSNTSSCPLTAGCSSQTCSGPDQKCVNGNCETAQVVYTSSYRVREDGRWQWYRTWVYCWSDGTSGPEVLETAIGPIVTSTCQ